MLNILILNSIPKPSPINHFFGQLGYLESWRPNFRPTLVFCFFTFRGWFHLKKELLVFFFVWVILANLEAKLESFTNKIVGLFCLCVTWKLYCNLLVCLSIYMLHLSHVDTSSHDNGITLNLDVVRFVSIYIDWISFWISFSIWYIWTHLGSSCSILVGGLHLCTFWYFDWYFCAWYYENYPGHIIEIYIEYLNIW